jgi:hypothetical protein
MDLQHIAALAEVRSTHCGKPNGTVGVEGRPDMATAPGPAETGACRTGAGCLACRGAARNDQRAGAWRVAACGRT